MLVEQPGVLSLTLLQSCYGVCGDIVGELNCFRSTDLNLAHMADIEKTD